MESNLFSSLFNVLMHMDSRLKKVQNRVPHFFAHTCWVVFQSLIPLSTFSLIKKKKEHRKQFKKKTQTIPFSSFLGFNAVFPLYSIICAIILAEWHCNVELFGIKGYRTVNPLVELGLHQFPQNIGFRSNLEAQTQMHWQCRCTRWWCAHSSSTSVHWNLITHYCHIN